MPYERISALVITVDESGDPFAVRFARRLIGKHIRPVGWNNWSNKANETTARYQEYNNFGEGANPKARATWSRQLTKKQATAITLENVFHQDTKWIPCK